MPTTSTRQDSEFIRAVVTDNLPTNLLETAIEFIADNFGPGDVFPIKELEDWAEENGYVKES